MKKKAWRSVILSLMVKEILGKDGYKTGQVKCQLHIDSVASSGLQPDCPQR